MKKIKQKTIKVFNYDEVINHIEKKYNIDTSNYDNYDFSQEEDCDKHYKQWLINNGYRDLYFENLVNNQKSNKEELIQSRKLYEMYEVADDGKKTKPKIEHPYLNFWNWLTDFDTSITNGSIVSLRTKDFDEMYPDWVREILTLIDKEFSPKDGMINLEVDW